MLGDPGLDARELAAAVLDGWGVLATDFVFVPGYDMQATTYAVETDEARRFLKVRLAAAPTTPLGVPRALLDAGVEHVVAPIRTTRGGLAHRLDDGGSMVLFPFIGGRNAMHAGMDADQWRSFGVTLRAVHESGLEQVFAPTLATDTFGLPSAAAVRQSLSTGAPHDAGSPPQTRLLALFVAQAATIGATLARAETLGAALAKRPFERVLCHADIHAANLLVADDGRIWLVDWDTPMIAPRERDLLFIIGSRIARAVKPHEEAWFFEGYGHTPVDQEAIVFYRYERFLEDMAAVAASVFGENQTSETSRASEVDIAEAYFAPGGMLETIERV